MGCSGNENLLNDLRKAFDSHYFAAIDIIPFSEMLKENPEEALGLIGKKYNEALDKAYTDEEGVNNRGYVEALAGGPFEAIPWALYNAVGGVYPYLDRFQRDKALKQVLSILDGRNYAEVNGDRGYPGHTTGIREPLLLSDICICRDLYWPGLKDEKHLWENTASFEELEEKIFDESGNFRREVVRSDFLVSYALLRSDFTSFGEDFALYMNIKNPDFLERTLKGIVGLRFARTETEDQIIDGKKRLEELLPEPVHNRIEPIRQEADWVDYKKFDSRNY